MDPQEENRIDLQDLNKGSKPKRVLPTIKNSFKKSAGPGRDHLGKFSSRGKLKTFKSFNWARALPIVLIISSVGGYLVFKSFAGAATNDYSCEKIDGAYPALKKESSPGKNDQSKDGIDQRYQCVRAVQWAFKNKAGQSQITVNGNYDEATAMGAIRFQKLFKFKGPDGNILPADGNLSSTQVAGVDKLLGGFKPYVDDSHLLTHIPDYPGQPRPGKVYWGSSKTNNGDVLPLEAESGVPLGVRRTFHNFSNPSTGVSVAKTDLAAGRIPVVSFTVSVYDWAAIGNGSKDTQVDSLLTALDALNGPVFLALQHEPEDNGICKKDANGECELDANGKIIWLKPAIPSEHVAMNRRVRERMIAKGTDNISLTQILMGVDYTPGAKYPAAQWYGDDIYDFLSIDHYYKDLNSWATSATTPIAQRDNVIAARKFAKTKGLDIMSTEFGLVSNTGSEGADLAQGYFNDAVKTPPADQARIIGISYFNSTVGTFGYAIEPTSPLHEMIYKTLPTYAAATHWSEEKLGAHLND